MGSPALLNYYRIQNLLCPVVSSQSISLSQAPSNEEENLAASEVVSLAVGLISSFFVVITG